MIPEIVGVLNWVLCLLLFHTSAYRTSQLVNR